MKDDDEQPVEISDFKTVGELREFLARTDLHENDLTNVTNIRVASDLVRVIMTTYYE